MEIKDRDGDDASLRGDMRMPEIVEAEIKGPSRARVMVHLTGIGFGCLLLMVGLGLGVSRNMWDKLALVPAILGAALVAGWVTINHGFLSSMVRNRRVMVGTNAVFMGLLAVVILTLVNYIGYRHYRKWDFTRSGLFTLSAKTENVLENLKQDVAIISLRSGTKRTGEEDTYQRFKDLMQLYANANVHIKVEYLLPDVDPEATKLTFNKYNLDMNAGLIADDVYVVSGERKKILRLGDMMQWEYYGDNPFDPQKRPVAFKGEQIITSAVTEVTSERQPKLYVLAGHGERSVTDAGPAGVMSLAGMLKRDGLAVDTLTGIPVSGVPADCDCLLVIGPQAPLVQGEVEKTRQYLDGGGRMLFCDDVGKTSGLEGLARDYGIAIGNDAVVALDARVLLGSATAILVSDFREHEITKPLVGFFVAFNLARSVTVASPLPQRVQAATLAETSAASYAETDLAGLLKLEKPRLDEGVDRKGPISLGVASERANAPTGEGAARSTRVVVFGDADVFSNNIVDTPYKNVDLARNAVGWLIERKEMIAIDARPEVEHLLAVDAAAKTAVFWLFVVGLPLVVLLAGGVIWALRSYGSRAA